MQASKFMVSFLSGQMENSFIQRESKVIHTQLPVDVAVLESREMKPTAGLQGL